MSFLNLGLSKPVLDAVQPLGFESASAIQAQSIPTLMAGRDLIGSAPTGPGQPAGLALPTLSHTAKPERTPRALILVPTRELACQVEESIRTFARFSHLRCAVLYGGVGYGKQLEALRCGTDIVVATPGRL